MNIVLQTLGALWSLFKYVLYMGSPVILVLILIMINTIYRWLLLYYAGQRPIKSLSTWRPRSLLKRLCIDFPKQLAIDMMAHDPNKFNKYGTILVTGGQGSGKTITTVYLQKKWSQQFVNLKSYSNFKVEGVEKFNGIEEMVERNNGEDGVLFMIDEISVWYNDTDSTKDFPPELLQDQNQQRKQRKCTLATAQQFHRVAKKLRDVAEVVYAPMTIFGCLTIVRVTRPKWWDEKESRFRKYQWLDTFCFVHSKELRESYDTYERVLRESRSAISNPSKFKPNPYIYTNKSLEG